MIRVLLATAEPAHPIATGGIQASAHDLLAGLSRRTDFDVHLLSSTPAHRIEQAGARLAALGIRHRYQDDRIEYALEGYRAYLVKHDAFGRTLKELITGTDVVVAQAAGWRSVVRRARSAGKPVVHWLHGWLGLLGDSGDLPAADLLLSNSEFTANYVCDRFGLRSRVFHPPVDPARARRLPHDDATATITLVNPHPDKGVSIFLELARRMRKAPFIAVDCWGTPPFVELALEREHNVEYLPVQTDIAAIYARTALLLVPTLVDETFGRVVVEANLNGVPVLASDRGALPYVVGGGGQIASPAAPFDCWVDAAESLTDPVRRERWSKAARRNSERFDFGRAIDEFSRMLHQLLGNTGETR